MDRQGFVRNAMVGLGGVAGLRKAACKSWAVIASRLRSTDVPLGAGAEHTTRLDPLYPPAHYQLGTVYRRLGSEADAHCELAAFERLEKAKRSSVLPNARRISRDYRANTSNK
jgi:hypothetical protein